MIEVKRLAASVGFFVITLVAALVAVPPAQSGAQLVVGFAPSTSSSMIRWIEATHGLDQLRSLPDLHARLVSVATWEVSSVRSALLANPHVTFVRPRST